jgi:signal peptidase I
LSHSGDDHATAAGSPEDLGSAVSDRAERSNGTAEQRVHEAPAVEHAVGPTLTQPRTSPSFWRELPVLVVVAVGLALLIKSFFLQAFYIPSGSMQNTLAIGDRVLVNKLVYDFRNPHRGEIVVFNGSGTGFEGVAEFTASQPGNLVQRGLRNVQGFLGLGGNPNEHDFIKRVIGVGGDVVACPASTGDPNRCDRVTVNGTPLDESGYLFEDNHRVFAPITLKKGELWVMGDHRGLSSDSRDHGAIPVDKVVGRAFVTIWPLGRFGGHGVPKTFDQKLAGAALAAAPFAVGSFAVLPVALVGRRRRRPAR